MVVLVFVNSYKYRYYLHSYNHFQANMGRKVNFRSAY